MTDILLLATLVMSMAVAILEVFAADRL